MACAGVRPLRALIVVALAAFAALAGLSGGAPGAASAGTVRVFAAASLATALDEIAADFEAASGHETVLAFAATSALARQIERGAPADVFIAAHPQWMDHLAARGRIDAESRFNVAANRLVVVAPAGAAPISLRELPARLGSGRLAIALTQAVPAGLYGREALRTLGLWEALAPRLAEADNVRAALALVALGEAPYGLVYASDAVAEPRVGVVARVPSSAHAPVRYPAALLAGRASPAARDFLAYLEDEAAQGVLQREGFLPR